MSDTSESVPVAPGRRAGSSRWLRVLVILGLTVLAGAALVAVTLQVAARDDQISACRAVAVADQVLPPVVTMQTRTDQGGGNGSGQVIRSGGYILTNFIGGFGCLAYLLVILGTAGLVGFGAALDVPALIVIAIVAAIALLAFFSRLTGALNGVFQASLYRYATTGDAGPLIDTTDAAAAFHVDRGQERLSRSQRGVDPPPPR